MELQQEGWSNEACVDFDFMIEEFDMWVEGRQDEVIEKPAPKNQKKVIHEKRFKSLDEVLGLTLESDAFASGSDEERLADLVASGEIALGELSGFIPPT